MSLAAFGLAACGGDDNTASTGTTDPTNATMGSTTDVSTTSTSTSSSSGVTDNSGTGSASDSTAVPTTDPTTGSSSSGANPVCGDGAVDPGEECDDANQDDTDACTNACKNAVCGDAIVGPGEACDDGNQVDDDACGNDCSFASCGDGKLQMGEECDDANADDTDMCLGTCLNAKCGDAAVQAGVEECDDGNGDDTDACVAGCKNATCGDTFVQAGVEECDDGNGADTDTCVAMCKNAKCGDGLVQMGVEACDDGNMSDADMCTTMCKVPACDDKIKDGTETDVDCGGTCPKCGIGKACGKGGDCGTGFCGMNVCAVATSCKAIKTADPMAANGIYNIDPDGGGPVVAFDVYCDMTIDGGGWTLVLKADGSKTTFLYNQAIWTNNLLLNANQTALDRTEAKFSSWNNVPFTDILVGLETPILNMGALNLKTQKITTGAKASMFALMSPNTYVVTTVGRPAWKALVTGSSLQLNCSREGFNTQCGGSNVRIGITNNQENDCNSCDSYLGLGGMGAPCGPSEKAVGNVAGCTPDNGDLSLASFGVVFVR